MIISLENVSFWNKKTSKRLQSRFETQCFCVADHLQEHIPSMHPTPPTQLSVNLFCIFILELACWIHSISDGTGDSKWSRSGKISAELKRLPNDVRQRWKCLNHSCEGLQFSFSSEAIGNDKPAVTRVPKQKWAHKLLSTYSSLIELVFIRENKS